MCTLNSLFFFCCTNQGCLVSMFNQGLLLSYQLRESKPTHSLQLGLNIIYLTTQHLKRIQNFFLQPHSSLLQPLQTSFLSYTASDYCSFVLVPSDFGNVKALKADSRRFAEAARALVERLPRSLKVVAQLTHRTEKGRAQSRARKRLKAL